MKTNLTISVNKKTLKEARKIALEQETSVNAIINEFLENLVQSQSAKEKAFDDIRRVIQEYNPRSARPRWTREEIYDRK